MVAVKSKVDPTFHGQEDIISAPEGSNVKTSKTGGRPAVERLARAVDESEKNLGAHREQFRLFKRQFVGGHDPMNLIYSLVSTLVPALAIEPKATVATVAGNLAFAETFRLAIDDELAKITLAKTMRRVITDSLFGMGIIKTGLKAAPGFADKGKLEIDSGTIFSERVGFGNYIIDMASSTRAGAQFEGDRYSISEDFARETGMFDEEVLQQLIAASDEQRKLAVDAGGSYNLGYASGVGWHNRVGFDDEFIRRLFLVDLFLPETQQVVTIPGDVLHSNLGFLREVDWDGDPSGPYDTVGFSPVPDRIIPVPVIAAIYGLYLLVNEVGRKIERQAVRQKDIAVYQKGREGDGDAVKESSDGEMIGLEDVEGVKVLSFGGASDDGYKTVAWAQELLNRIAGNPDLLGGVGKDAPTLGQDQMSFQNANARVDDWRQTALDTSASVLKKIAGYIWTDTDTQRSLEFRDGDLKFPRTFGKTRQGEFEQYLIGIDAHHRPPMSPDQRFLRTQRWITEVLLPLNDAATSQGLALDVQKVAEITARDLGITNDAGQMFVPIEDLTRQLQPQNQAGPRGPAQSPANPERGPVLSQPKPSLEGV